MGERNTTLLGGVKVLCVAHEHLKDSRGQPICRDNFAFPLFII